MRLTFTRLQALCLVVAMLGVVLLFYSVYATPYDDTDPPGGRSGMDLLTDHRTGCQYLYRRGAITPRMGRDGRQICEQPAG